MSEEIDTSCVAPFRSFDELGLHPLLVRGLLCNGLHKASPVQERVIEPLARGHDVNVQSPPWTGKTSGFAIGLLQRCDFSRRKRCQVLILTLTRELAYQTQDLINRFASLLSGNVPVCTTLVGGVPVQHDLKKLEVGGFMMAVGTPGRVADVINRGGLCPESLTTIVFDEVDTLLSWGVTQEIDGIMKRLLPTVQVALFSTTTCSAPEEVAAFTQKFLRNPLTIDIQPQRWNFDKVHQFYVTVAESDKLETTVDLFKSLRHPQCIVFANTRRKVETVLSALKADGHAAAAMHAETKLNTRDSIFASFHDGGLRTLVTTDLIVRGIDLRHAFVIFNYDLPSNVHNEDYLRRLGGRTHGAVVINLVPESEIASLHDLEAHYQTSIPELPADFPEYLR